MSTDAALKDSVLAELAWEPAVTAAHIGVTARDGLVTLTGHVQRYAEKHAAEVAARRVRGVKGVAEEIEVKLPYDVQRDDEAIAKAAVDRLAWDSTLPADAIKVTVQDGWVTLTGQVGWRYEHDAAANDVRGLWGVIGVSNRVTLKPRVDSYNLRLSERRAKAAADGLVALGVPVAGVDVSWKGKSDLAVPTPDGVKEPLNRRSSIKIVF